MAALVDESQMKTIEEYVESARQEGGDIFQPDINLPSGGYFYKPTLITNVSTVSRVVQEEIFGPIAVAMPFRTAKEAINLGNNTCYGLGSSVWSNSLPKTLEVAITLKAGAVWVNCHNQFDAAAGFGGYKVGFSTIDPIDQIFAISDRSLKYNRSLIKVGQRRFLKNSRKFAKTTIFLGIRFWS